MATVAVTTREVELAMRGAPILQSTPASALDVLAAAGTVRSYRRGTYVFHQGDPSHEVYFLVSGLVEISSLSVTGYRQLHTALSTPQLFGELGVLGELPRTATAVALEESVLWVTGGGAFMDFLGGHFDAARELLRSLASQIQAHESFVEDLLHLDLKGRVAKRLLQLVSPGLDDLPPDGAMIPAVVTHADLASLCGGSRENVTRILSEFQRRKLIERAERRYVLKNVDGLAKLAGL
ncbi:MAG TPA: Crp/Fnr family transcriptional regulator [Actinomycetota bacterium]|nr:Crp/Fnr family transcriptional regulator [Actinomycetota bacterium]